MAIGDVAIIGALETTGTGAFNLDGVTDFAPATAPQTTALTAAGEIDPSWVSVIMQESGFAATVTDIATALDNFDSLVGLEIGTVAQATLVAHIASMQSHGAVQSGSNHRRVTINQGLVVPTSLTCDRNGVARLAIQCFATYDGTNEPLVYGASSALPSGILIAEAFTLGQPTINGTDVDGVDSFTMDFGLQVIQRGTPGDNGYWPTAAYIVGRSPSFTLRVTDSAALTTFGLDGTAQGGTASQFYLQALTNMGTRTAEASAAHVKITMNTSQGLIVTGGFSGSGNDLFSGEIRCQPIKGSSAIITVATGQAIT